MADEEWQFYGAGGVPRRDVGPPLRRAVLSRTAVASKTVYKKVVGAKNCARQRVTASVQSIVNVLFLVTVPEIIAV